MYTVVFKPIAADEYSEAIIWYKEQSNLAAERFIVAIEEKLDLIAQNPRQYKKVFREFYESRTKRFPFTIVYSIEEELKAVMIVAIYHQKRNPRKKYRG